MPALAQAVLPVQPLEVLGRVALSLQPAVQLGHGPGRGLCLLAVSEEAHEPAVAVDLGQGTVLAGLVGDNQVDALRVAVARTARGYVFCLEDLFCPYGKGACKAVLAPDGNVGQVQRPLTS